MDHAARAAKALATLDQVYETDLSIDEVIAAAQVHATLALVEQQKRVADALEYSQAVKS